MSYEPNGELVPKGGGDPIPLVRPVMKIGRRESCDICLRFPNISGQHGELTFQDGFWQVSDLGSTNGIKVNGVRVQQKTLRPGDEVSVANHSFTIRYSIPDGIEESDMANSDYQDVMNASLLERAGLSRKRDKEAPSKLANRPAGGRPKSE